MNDELDKILNGISTTGGKISYLRDLKQRCLFLIRNYDTLRDSLNVVETNLISQTQEFLDSKNIYGVNYVPGLSTGIYLFDEEKGDYSFNIVGGKKNRNTEEDLSFKDTFDLASITKFFTLLLYLKFDQENMIDFNTKVGDACPMYSGLEDFTINDLIRMHGEIMTKGNIKYAKSEEEARTILKSAYLISKRKDKNKYNDIGPMILADVIVENVRQIHPELDSYDKVMDYYLFSPLGLEYTHFSSEVHDPKARVLNGICGHAGIFSNSHDMSILARNLFSYRYLDQSHLDKLGEITFPNDPKCSKGNMGMYIKHPKGLESTYVPNEFSDLSVASQGWTGALCTFDPHNKMHYSILTNAIYESDNEEEIKNDKPINFGSEFRNYQGRVTENILMMYVVKKYYNDYLNVHENIESKKLIKKA